MRILVISNLYPPDFLGGYELGCRQVVDALRAAGHDVLVLTTAPRSRPVPAEPGVDRRLVLADVYDAYCRWKTAPAFRAVQNQQAFGVQAFNVHVLTEALESFRPDVAYVWNLVGTGGLGLLAALQHTGTPWVMHLMDNVPGELCALDRDRPAIPELGEAFVRLCRGQFICCSQTTVDEITRAGVPIGPLTRLLPNWVVVDGTPDRTEYMPGGRLRIVSAGAMATFKGMDLIIRAAGLLRDRGYDNFSVDLYGHGTDPMFRNLVQYLGLQQTVRILGARTQSQLYALYPHYDLFVFPTWEREPFGFAPMEAMAHGCAVVASRMCGFSEWFVHGVDCLKSDRTPEAFADAIQQILCGEVSLPEIGRRASRVVLRDFHMSVLLPKIEAELRAAVRAGGGPAHPPAEAHRLALLAEKSFQSLLYEAA